MKDANTQQQIIRIRDEVLNLGGGLNVAVDTIMAACDGLRNIAEETDNARVNGLVMRIYEACTVQDIATQRLNKILRLLARIENPDLPDDDPLLEGPQNDGKGISQAAINRLLEDDES